MPPSDDSRPVDRKILQVICCWWKAFKIHRRCRPSVTMRSAQITGILAPMIAISVVMQQILSLLGAPRKSIRDVRPTGMGGYYAVLFTAMAIVFLFGYGAGEPAEHHHPGADPGADRAWNRGRPGALRRDLPGRRVRSGSSRHPYGLNLYVASGVTGVPYFKLLANTSVPYLVSLIIGVVHRGARRLSCQRSCCRTVARGVTARPLTTDTQQIRPASQRRPRSAPSGSGAASGNFSSWKRSHGSALPATPTETQCESSACRSRRCIGCSPALEERGVPDPA